MPAFGLLGFPLTHSFSQKYFTEKFSKLKLQGFSYQNFELKDIANLKSFLAGVKDLKGFNITIPHKKNILAYLDQLTPAVEKIQACNCVYIQKDKWVGYNTDYIGFQETLIPKLAPHNNRALVLGNGGAAEAVCYVLNRLNIPYKIVTRSPQREDHITYSDLTVKIVSAHTLIINTTPLGTYPKITEYPPIPYQYLTTKHYLYDLIYNPSPSIFLKKGMQAGTVTENGYKMLEIQAEASWEIWNQ
jgi:shikimate dehydrogenase